MKRYRSSIAMTFLMLMALWQCRGQHQVSGTSDRQPAVAGSFYPAGRQELLTMLDAFFIKANIIPECRPQAVVVPHAGYVFSGAVAAAGFKQLDRQKTFNHIFIIGPNHRAYIDGAVLFEGDNFITPLGKVPIDPLTSKLIRKFRFLKSDPGPHRQEHCIEVQLPFLQYWLKKPFSIIPILVGGDSPETARQLGKILEPYFLPENLFVISADFSHYPPYADAVKADHITADAILANNSVKFLASTEKNERNFGPGLQTSICGWMPMLALLEITEKQINIEYKEILYKNSGDTQYGDRDKVVGYWALAVQQKQDSEKEFSLSDSEKKILLQLARNTITNYLNKREIPETEVQSLPPALLTHAGAFVTLKNKRELRGCIGNFFSDEPLYKTVQNMAVSAATRDTRFLPVRFSEMQEIDIEISVLTPLKRIHSIDEFKLGRDGIYMKNGNRSGTFLPQVAEETGWNLEEFMGHCAQDKAFIGWNGWKEKGTELYTYQALVFGETDTPQEGRKKHK